MSSEDYLQCNEDYMHYDLLLFICRIYIHLYIFIRTYLYILGKHCNMHMCGGASISALAWFAHFIDALPSKVNLLNPRERGEIERSTKN